VAVELVPVSCVADCEGDVVVTAVPPLLGVVVVPPTTFPRLFAPWFIP